jgi:O-acetyl-ADP-ribose deacetylase (regulator of RNase III)
MERAARIAVREVTQFLGTNHSIERVVFVCFGKDAFEIHSKATDQAASGDRFY